MSEFKAFFSDGGEYEEYIRRPINLVDDMDAATKKDTTIGRKELNAALLAAHGQKLNGRTKFYYLGRMELV